jgi:hypothetical protein
MNAAAWVRAQISEEQADRMVSFTLDGLAKAHVDG